MERDLRARRARVAGEHTRVAADVQAGRLPAHRHVREHLAGLQRELGRIDALLAGGGPQDGP